MRRISGESSHASLGGANRSRQWTPWIWMTVLVIALTLYVLVFPALNIAIYLRQVDPDSGIGKVLVYFFYPLFKLDLMSPTVHSAFESLGEAYARWLFRPME